LVSLSLLPSHLFPFRLALHRADRLMPQLCVRMGRPGRRAGTHTELTHVPVTQSRGSTRVESPFCPRPVTLMELGRPLVVGHVVAPAPPPIGAPRPPLFPCAALTGTLKVLCRFFLPCRLRFGRVLFQGLQKSLRLSGTLVVWLL
jgi:hypothetical protein